MQGWLVACGLIACLVGRLCVVGFLGGPCWLINWNVVGCWLMHGLFGW